MEELFNILSSSARLNKQKRLKKLQSNNAGASPSVPPLPKPPAPRGDASDSGDDDSDPGAPVASRDRTGKRDASERKRDQVHREQVAAFRRSMGIRIARQHHHHQGPDDGVPDPMVRFRDLSCPSWWLPPPLSAATTATAAALFGQLHRVVLANIERGRWREPTPIQMQAVPALLERRDLIGAACTGSGKSGAFLIPMILLTGAPRDVFYRSHGTEGNRTPRGDKSKRPAPSSRAGEIRGLVLAPSMELATQLHREYERLSLNLPGGSSCLLLSKSNAPNVIAGAVGGKRGLDVLVSTPLRLVDSIRKGLRLNAVRIVIMDESDRLLDAADGKSMSKGAAETGDGDVIPAVSGSSQTLTFLSQLDAILAEIPATATRALFSATITPTVRSLADSILRHPIDITIRTSTVPGGANPNIQQKLVFVGREEGKLLAIRQLVQRGELRPPVIIFLQSKERAQALFSELLYDGIHVDVIHAARSKSARENAVAKFRRGETWVLIATDLVARGVDFRAVNMVINYDLPESGITYIHRIGRCGRAGRHGEAITFFTEMDFTNLRTIANVMKQSGCPVEDWMLQLPSQKRRDALPPRRPKQSVDTTPRFDRVKKRKKRIMIENSQKRAKEEEKPKPGPS